MIEEGNLKTLYRNGVGRDSFEIYSEEYEWLEKRFENRKSISWRSFLKRFPNFEKVIPQDPVEQLIEELQSERAYSQVYSLLDSVGSNLTQENAIETAEHVLDVIHDVVKSYSPHADISIKDFDQHFETIRQYRLLAKSGQTIGMPTGLPSIDYHWDGFIPGRLIAILARPGQLKSMCLAFWAWQAIKNGYRLGLFSPEMNEFEHTCRVHTIASHEKWVQEELGLKTSFKNRSLMRGTGFSLKEYKRFGAFIKGLPGDCRIFTKKYRQNPMTIKYVASRVEDLGLHGVMADPLSKLQTGRYKDNPVWEDYERVGQFQELGETNNIFCIATNWSNREPTKKKKEDAPDLDTSFGSDALAKESDHVIGLYHDEEERTLHLKCTKSRFGRMRFRIEVRCSPNSGLFEETNIPSEVQEQLNNGTNKNGGKTANDIARRVREIIKEEGTNGNKPKKAKRKVHKVSPESISTNGSHRSKNYRSKVVKQSVGKTREVSKV